MSRSYKKQPFWSVCKGDSKDKVIASRTVRRANRRLIRLTKDWEDYSPLHRLDCNYNDVWSWNSDGKKRYRPLDYYKTTPIIVEVDDITQVERVLDGLPALNVYEDKHEYWFKKMLRK